MTTISFYTYGSKTVSGVGAMLPSLLLKLLNVFQGNEKACLHGRRYPFYRTKTILWALLGVYEMGWTWKWKWRKKDKRLQSYANEFRGLKKAHDSCLSRVGVITITGLLQGTAVKSSPKKTRAMIAADSTSMSKSCQNILYGNSHR